MEADVSIQVVAYLEKLPAVREAAGSALLALGDGNWRMGEGAAVRAGPKLAEGDERVILEHFTHDVITTTLATLAALGTASRRPALGGIFQLNNVTHLQGAVLHPMRDVRALLGKPTRDALTSGFRTAKAAYFDANYSPLMQALADDGAKKAAMKDKFTRFYDLLEEVAERHRVTKVLEDDEESREQVCEEVVKLVIPSLQRFTQKGREKEFSKSKSLTQQEQCVH
jgi:exocyst complex protein 7